MSGRMIVRCARCGLALTQSVRFEEDVPRPVPIDHTAISGPCIGTEDGLYLPNHDAVHAEWTLDAPLPLGFAFPDSD